MKISSANAIKLITSSLAVCLVAGSALADTAVTVTIDASSQGSPVASNFAGISCEINELMANVDYTGFRFDTDAMQSPSGQEVINLAENMGLKHIRIGAGSGEARIYGTDFSQASVDAFMHFAGSIGAKVTFGVRLLGSASYNPMPDSTNLASHVWSLYRPTLDTISIGNEPDVESYHTVDPAIYDETPGVPGTAFPSYEENTSPLGQWRKFANSIGGATTGIAFSGPDDTGGKTFYPFNNGTTSIEWALAMVKERSAGKITYPFNFASTHYYVDPNSEDQLTGTTNMLSAAWLNNYADHAAKTTDALRDFGWHYRYTELNDHFATNTVASYTFASALWGRIGRSGFDPSAIADAIQSGRDKCRGAILSPDWPT